MARPKGFEPLTPRFVVWCSIQLSYGRAVPGKRQGRDIGGRAGRRNPPSWHSNKRQGLLVRCAKVPVFFRSILESAAARWFTSREGEVRSAGEDQLALHRYACRSPMEFVRVRLLS